MKCPECGQPAIHDRLKDVFYCPECVWDEELDGMARA